MKINRCSEVMTALFLVFFIHGCASTGFLMAQPEVTMFGEAGTPKPSTVHVDTFYTEPPDREYDEIAQISVGGTDDNWNMEQIKIKARELGADGVIIIGRVGSYGYGTATGTSTGSFGTTGGIGVGAGYGLVAIAIIYK